ncbi:putative Cyclin-like superfamily, cyclin/Cyclin-like subunit Ssn8 [Helianthus annuus]|nr:putative Cyclin-like superfamily, cyclin/Cyclin-like subunit Ssn8 [Helianthus annuus]KAJ0607326.1 putative Cyclin-like superfamily, cyclin/Cyclin-like subunit Ssn8 [Helianthus annuus]KAJ0773224.1 putative Cyclin-like superfamily, cyclin/Cyclin-like subunit Ssn8 [Helianthus annuus]KAJ0800672.1 putative Cyclin-like superfamily, cyclin/Cyclin-like subunit Ssn8 [Helianthus annuus]
MHGFNSAKMHGKMFTRCCFLLWLRSSLWLQFKPHQIAAGAAYLAARSLNMDLTSCQNVWQEFYTPPSVLKDVVQQLMELF